MLAQAREELAKDLGLRAKMLAQARKELAEGGESEGTDESD